MDSVFVLIFCGLSEGLFFPNVQNLLLFVQWIYYHSFLWEIDVNAWSQ